MGEIVDGREEMISGKKEKRRDEREMITKESKTLEERGE